MSDNSYHQYGSSFAEHCEQMDEERRQELARDEEQERRKRNDWYSKIASKNDK